MSFQLALGPRVRKSPFFNSTVTAGVTSFTVYNHMYLPISYGDAKAEYARLMEGVALWDVAAQRQVSLKGPDALALARLLTPRNLDDLTIGQSKYIPMTNAIGTVINDPILLQVSHDEIWLSIADSDMKFWVDAIAMERQMQVEVTEPDVSPLAVQGPKAEAVVASLFGEWVRDIRYFGFTATQLDGIPLILARAGWSKQGGFEMYLQDSQYGDALWEAVAEAGKPFDIGPGAPNPIERVESGLISVNTDTDAYSNPFEMGLGKYVDLNQEVDFIGKQALQEIERNGIRRQFCGLILDGTPLNASNTHPWPVTLNGGYVGFASAAAYSPRLKKNIAAALITTEAATPNTELLVDGEEGVRNATPTDIPFK